MTKITPRDEWLHYPDGTHRSTPDSDNGTVIATFEQSLARHFQRHAEGEGESVSAAEEEE
jgi:hypothetical protein